MAVVERFKQESVYELSAKKVAVVERWPVSGGSAVSYFVEVPQRFCSLSCKLFLYQVRGTQHSFL